jgi:hypothetical protein
MLDGEEIKQILYTVIEEIGRKKFRQRSLQALNYRKNILIS